MIRAMFSMLLALAVWLAGALAGELIDEVAMQAAPATTTVASDFDRFTDAQAATKVTNPRCGLVTRPCHLPDKEYEALQPTLADLIDSHFNAADREWAVKVAFCESSAKPTDWHTDKVNPLSGATGWFQHLPKFWEERSQKAGYGGFPISHPVSDVAVAAWLLYHTPQGSSHWRASQSCWGSKV